MKTIEQLPPRSGMGLQDILFILFKHKWKIIFLSLLGLGAAAAVYLRTKPVYESTAKLLVKYVLERSEADLYETQRDASGRTGAPIILAEVAILTSQDLAIDVTEKLGPETLQPNAEGSATLVGGALTIQGGLNVGAEHGSNVLEVAYRNPDPDLAKEVLRELVDRYFERHLTIHRSIGAFEYIAEKIDQARSQLKKTGDEMGELRNSAEQIALADSTGSLQAQRALTREDLMTAQAELAEQQARIDYLDAQLAVPEDGDEPDEDPEPEPGAQELAKYRALLERLSLLHQQKLEMETKYRPGSRMVTLSQEQIDKVEAQRKALAKRFPSLAAKAAALNQPAGATGPDPETERTRLAAFKAKVAALNAQMERLEGQYSKLLEVEGKIKILEARKEIEEEKYRTLESRLLKAQNDEALDPSRMPNIVIVQHPSAPVKTVDEKTKKIVLGLAVSGIILGVGLALLIELVLDQRVMRPIEIETRMHIPLMLSIPRVALNGATHVLPAPRPGLPMAEESGEIVLPDVPEAEAGDVPIDRQDHFIRPYADAIRDRLFYYFELNDMTHKPKLVAVTGISEGSGTSTVASGLATAFAEVEDAKVLLVDMNMNHDNANPVFESRQSYSLLGALKAGRGVEFKESRQNLFLATGTLGDGGKVPRTLAPRKLFDLMPVLRASEYDYIIFDMPPTGPTSPTLAMAGFMDQVLLVLDAQNTNRDALKRTHTELVQGKAEVSCIFNKTRSHAPRWVQGEA